MELIEMHTPTTSQTQSTKKGHTWLLGWEMLIRTPKIYGNMVSLVLRSFRLVLTMISSNGRRWLHISLDGFIITLSYMDTHLCHALCNMIGQLNASSDQWDWDRQICTQIGLSEIETEEHIVFHYVVFSEIRWRYHYLFKHGFGPLSKVMACEDQ